MLVLNQLRTSLGPAHDQNKPVQTSLLDVCWMLLGYQHSSTFYQHIFSCTLQKKEIYRFGMT